MNIAAGLTWRQARPTALAKKNWLAEITLASEWAPLYPGI